MKLFTTSIKSHAKEDILLVNFDTPTSRCNIFSLLMLAKAQVEGKSGLKKRLASTKYVSFLFIESLQIIITFAWLLFYISFL